MNRKLLLLLVLLIAVATGARAALTGSGTQADPWKIGSTADWTEFCTNSNTYKAGFVKMTANVTAADNKYFNNTFTGTFDGDGHYLSVNISVTGVSYIAPFTGLDGGTIKNLRIFGSVSTGSYHSSGLIGSCNGTCTIQNCVVTACLTDNTTFATICGFIGHANSATVNITDCLLTAR